VVGVLPQQLATDLRSRLSLSRAIETGTYRGRGTRLLASVFPEVITIEVAPQLAQAARGALADLPGVAVREGSSRDVLPETIDGTKPTLYWLDGHWSGGVTGGAEDECPVLAEIAAIAAGHPDDCILIDDARLFLAPPSPPHRAEQWPSYREIEDAVHATRPDNLVLVAHDIIVSVPASATNEAVAFAHGKAPRGASLPRRALDRAFSR
jgi:hypothetical protein